MKGLIDINSKERIESKLVKKYLLIFLATSILTACSQGTSYNDNGTKGNDVGTQCEIENPYSEGSGHYAGYEWAERTGGDCSGNSQSFNEGCEEYFRQLDSCQR